MNSFITRIGLTALIFIFTALYSVTTGHGGLEKGTVNIGSAKLSYEAVGEGTALILVHAGSMDMRVWDDQFAEFAKHYRVIRYDARGHGGSRNEPDTFSHHEDLRRLMDALNILKAVIIGLSMGGYIAIDFTLAYPERVLALIPAGSGLTGYEFKDSCSLDMNKKMRQAETYEQAVEYIQRVWTDGPYRQPEDVNPLVREKIRMMYTDFFMGLKKGSREQRLSPAAIGRLSEIAVPTLTIHGALDVPGILEIAGMIVKKVNGAREVSINGAAHVVNMEKPAEFNQAVISFLRGLNLNDK